MITGSESFVTPGRGAIRLHVLHWGPNSAAREGDPTLLLLHGGGANAHWWDHVAPRFARRWHVVALDFRGHGDSDHPEELIVGAFGDDLEALIEHLGHPPVVVLGHSMGGGVALAHAAVNAADASIRGVIAVDVARGASRRSRRAARLALALRRTYASREEAIARYRFLPTSSQTSEELRLAIAEHSVRELPDGRYGFKFDPRWFTIGSRERPPLSEIRCPVLVIRGESSPMLTAEGAATLLSELSDGRLTEIEHAGHHIQLDQPAAFQDAVETFLASL